MLFSEDDRTRSSPMSIFGSCRAHSGVLMRSEQHEHGRGREKDIIYYPMLIHARSTMNTASGREKTRMGHQTNREIGLQTAPTRMHYVGGIS